MQHAMNQAPSTPLHLVTTEQIQKYLDENRNLIVAIMESQKTGKVAECAQYQAILQKNLMYLAAIADAQPQGSTLSSPAPSSVTPHGNSQMMQTPSSAMQQQAGGSIPKLPFQLNALRPQDQQNQLMQFQQMQGGHFSLGGGANNGLHMLMQPGAGNSGGLRDLRMSQQPGSAMEASSGDAQGNSGLGHMEGRE
ncbi:GRF1-interacting factor 2-like isoform X2 [Andrographis paniculata]|uniref:GRF1-interacting factor 2-like isoform X2 n=1 Tax=Andrographis paniculata TaxID=175694 RepID=UPI0021E9AC22|nr:GRF1-interacting factor 2-like isoform X2 [Andrographis paniculata]